MQILNKDFLTVLFPRDGYIETRAMLRETLQRDFATSIPCALAFLYKVKDGLNVYFGVAARASKGEGCKGNLLYSAALWVDIDAPNADQRLASSGLPAPSVLVATGTAGHRQAYWLLEEPYDLRGPEAIAQFEAYLRGIVKVTGGDKACVDASRLLRMPNTRNFKHQPAPFVDILVWQPERRYYLENFPIGEVIAACSREFGEAVEPKRQVAAGWLRSILEGGYDGQWNADHSEVDFKVACHLLDEGFAPEEALWRCIHSAIGQRKRNHLAYWRRTIAKAMNRTGQDIL